MELYTTIDGTIAKYVHDDGSETAIKTWPEGMASCGGSGREKFNVFASCSVGCEINCGFCFLTSKSFPHHTLSVDEIADNVLSAIKTELHRRPNLEKVPFNLSWMGMGDPWNKLNKICEATERILEGVDGLVEFIEGVDIATSLPCASYEDIRYLKDIDRMLQLTNKLMPRPSTRTNVRVFYSLHSVINKTRRQLIPNTLDVDAALIHLDRLSKYYNVIYHYIFLNGINDTGEHIDKLIDIFRWSDSQLRILRYNECPNSKYVESENLLKIVDKLAYNLDSNNIKVQLSPGSEISAACGMFLMGHK